MHPEDDWVLIAVAMDVGGISACKRFYDEVDPSYVTLVDAPNALGEALDFKLVPNGFAIDEAGVLQFKKLGGFEIRRDADLQAMKDFLARPAVSGPGIEAGESDEDRIARLKRELSNAPGNHELRFELGRLLMRQGKTTDAFPHLRDASEAMPKHAQAQFAFGTLLLELGHKYSALREFREALALDRDNYLYRKQIWAVEYPERCHPEIDWAWQSEQMRKERAAEGGGTQ